MYDPSLEAWRMRKSLPRWARLGAVLGVALLAAGLGLFTYRYLTRPVTLTVAAGSVDGDAVRMMLAIASKLVSTNSSVRLKVVDAETALGAAQALSSGRSDLAIIRSDLGDLSSARSVALLTHVVVLVIAPAGSPIKEVEGLKGKTLGILGGSTNKPIAEMLSKSFDLARMQIKNLDLDDVRPAIQSKQIHALLAVVPISERYIAALRALLPSEGKRHPTLIAIESAEAIAAIAKAYESYELPKGTFRGSPAIPDDDLTTLRVPVHLVAKSTLNNDTVGALAKALMESRRELISEFPLVTQITAPSSDKDATIPVHPGAKAYFEGEEKTVFDKYGDQFFYGTLILGTLTSALAAVWKFILGGSSNPEGRLIDRLTELTARIRSAKSDEELAAIEDEINAILQVELDGLESQEAALNVAAARLERLIHLRSGKLGPTARPGEAAAT
jgi:TRAP transporter TAXI family solute receptor